MPSGVCSTNPAFTGRRETRRAISRGMLAPSEEGRGVPRPAVPCQCVTGRCVCHSGCSSRGQPREAGSLSRVPGGMENSPQCFSVGPEYYRERVFLRFRFRGRSVPISGSSVRPSTVTPNIHEVYGCCYSPVRLQGIRILNYIDDWLILA